MIPPLSSPSPYDVLVLGAGIVGVCTALHLQQKGMSVALVDRGEPGEGCSFGNAGLIQSEAVLPYAFPQSLKTILGYATNRQTDAHIVWRSLPALAPALFRYWRAGRPASVQRTIAANLPLYAQCIPEHLELALAADAEGLFRADGWIKLFRKDTTRAAEIASHAGAARLGVKAVELDRAALDRLQPGLAADVVGGLHYPGPLSLSDPYALTRAYFDLFVRRGGRLLRGDALTLEAEGSGWAIRAADGLSHRAIHAVAALGPWSQALFARFGYRVPLFTKRGYHMHYRPPGGTPLRYPLLDVDGGFMITPMARGIRLTTGAEFAGMDVDPTPVQLDRVEPMARRLFPLGDRVDAAPWMGLRPCMPDMLPVIGAAPRHSGLWFACGHGHHGLTLAAVTGRLLAEMIAGEQPFTDPAPYRPDRF